MFKDRKEAGALLAKKLISYRDQDVVVLALPRGGALVAQEIASLLNASLDLIFAHKIGHPLQEEFAIAAISEHGHLVGNQAELERLPPAWLEEKKQAVLQEIKRRRDLYLKGREALPLKDKIAILVDDGIATGLTAQAAILELRSLSPKKLVLAVPVTPKSTGDVLKNEVDELVALIMDPDDKFLGSVGAYYKVFPQVSDKEVLDLF